jgi:hypothetical protein
MKNCKDCRKRSDENCKKCREQCTMYLRNKLFVRAMIKRKRIREKGIKI